MSGAAVVLLAYWLRDPLIPYGGRTPDASAISSESARSGESAARREEALAAIASEIRSAHVELGLLARTALGAPRSSDDAFAHLRKLPRAEYQGVVLFERGQPVAWSGQVRNPPVLSGTGTLVSLSDFYVTLQVAIVDGARHSIATALIHADRPASEIALALDERLGEREMVESFRFAPAGDSAGGLAVKGAGGHELMRVDATPLSPGQVRFAAAAATRLRGVALLAVLAIVLIAAGWSDRRKPGRRFFTIAALLTAVALVPWNEFSNYSGAFDPARYYSSALGPFSGTAGEYAMFAALVLLAMIAAIRARRVDVGRFPAALAAAVFAIGGPVIAHSAARGISLPPRGSTATLWLQWQAPVFLTLFACWLGAAWLAAIALRRKPMIQLRAAALIAVLSSVIASFLVWNNTTEQRLQLAMRDVAGLERAEPDGAVLLSRFGEQLSAFGTPGTRADLLERYARSDLAAAEVQVSLGLWNAAGARYGSLDLAPLAYDTVELARAVSEADTSMSPVVTVMLGPAGRQLALVVPHRDGGSTTVVASPPTRLVAQDPYAALLGFEQPDQTEPPYVLTLADAAARGIARPDTMTWRRVGNEWHGDEIIETSRGPARAHVEVDLRAWSTRLVRVTLIAIFNVGIAGLLWALGVMAEGGVFRWLRARASSWAHSYRGRLTLALFTFFVVPAVAFAAWSYQRLRGDDRDVRELLVRETLHAAAGEDPLAPQTGHAAGQTPLFVYSGGMLASSSDPLYEIIAPAGRLLPPRVHMVIANAGELTASWQQTISNSKIFWGFRAASSPARQSYVLAAPARSDELVLDRRRRDLTMLVLFATAAGGIAAFWLSGIAARVLARDLELSRVEVARAERVLAWGEMARQIAHEIKNPLTPIRLGVQHLRRARADARIDFDRVLDENVSRILTEIDRLDEIARAFSRYGSAPSELPPPEPVDVAAILRDVVGLEKMGIGGVTWTLSGADEPATADARPDELREVLLNVFENARLARARNVGVELLRGQGEVSIEVADDGAGIPASALPRVFEPHFSTRTTGSGLGLAISRRLLESWGGTIDIQSGEGSGARVVITLRQAS